MSLKIHQLESFGTLDGPGLRSVVFLSGCNKRCLYCHNADTWIISNGKTWSEDHLFEWIVRNRNYYLKNGGVTFSGGEPLLQSKALKGLCMRLKKEGFHIAIDTAGVRMDQDVEALLEIVDLVILDVKHVNPETHVWLTGETLEITIRFIESLIELKKEYWIRQVIVEGINDSIEEMKMLEHMTFSRFRSKIELIPHHNMGCHKWPTDAGMRRLDAIETSEETMERLNHALLFFSKKDKTNEMINNPIEI